ncbi:MAG: hypothetical protein JOZ41_01865 [Chloroflexi bacterium]|nr:hypothetical protein [Chloroflexota bacterium]
METLALGVDRTAVPVIDERPATRYAVERGLGTATPLAVLVDLHRRGLATRTVEEDVEALRGAGMYLTEDLIAWTIERAQASGPTGPERRDVLGR